MNKKQIRLHFNTACLKRDRGRCVVCNDLAVDVHHITNRNDIANGGYVLENGISLCSYCHLMAEDVYFGRIEFEAYSPSSLYTKIGSSLEEAIEASNV